MVLIDISIMNGELFEKVASTARLKKKAFRKLDGCIDLDITFDRYTMCTPIYVKMDACDSLLLSEGVCRQFGIITYQCGERETRGTIKVISGADGLCVIRTNSASASTPNCAGICDGRRRRRPCLGGAYWEVHWWGD